MTIFILDICNNIMTEKTYPLSVRNFGVSSFTSETAAMINAKRWNEDNHLRPGEVVFFRNSLSKIPDNRDVKSSLDKDSILNKNVNTQYIQLGINDTSKSKNINSTDAAMGYSQITDATSLLVGPNTKASFYGGKNYTKLLFTYPYGENRVDNRKEGGGVADLHWFPGDKKDYNNSINSVKVEWLDKSLLKKSCCIADDFYDSKFCGEYWGPSNTGRCDSIFANHCAKEAEKIGRSLGPNEKPYDEKCICFNWKKIMPWKDLRNDLNVTGHDIIKPQCDINDCINFGYKTKGMVGFSCPALTLCQQIDKIQDSEKVKLNAVSMHQVCPSSGSGTAISPTTPVKPSDIQPHSETSGTSGTWDNDDTDTDTDTLASTSPSSKASSSSGMSSTTMWIIISVAVFLFVFIIVIIAISKKSSSNVAPVYY